MFGIIYRYITQPEQTISRDFAPFKAALFIVIVASIAPVVPFSESIFGRWIFGISPVAALVLTATVGIITWIIHTAFTEMIAQLMGYTTPRLVLLSWLGMAQSPLILTLPLGVLEQRLIPPFHLPFSIAIGCVPWVWLVFQTLTLKKLYNVAWGRALLILMMPYIALIGISVSVMVVIGFLLW